MAIKNTKLGGTDWIETDVPPAADLNDTFTACTTYKNTNYNYSLAPIGSVIAYYFDYANSHQLIPSGWIECNGNLISDVDSVYNGQTSPDLNGTTDTDSLFLRGNTTSGGTGGYATHGHGYATRGQRSGVNSYASLIPGAASSIPKYFNVKWIMRIK